MKAFFKSVKYFTLIIMVAFVAACNPDDDKDVDQREKFLGSWTCTETSSQNPNPINFSVSFSKNELTENEMSLNNFYHLGFEEKTTVIVNFSNVSIPEQVVCNLNVSGSGAYNNSKVNLVYYVNDGADIDTVNAVLNR